MECLCIWQGQWPSVRWRRVYCSSKKKTSKAFDWVACKQAPSLFFLGGGGWVGRLSRISYMRALRQTASGCLSFRARRGEWKSNIMQINDKREELPLSFLASTLDLLCLKRKKNKRLPAQISRAQKRAARRFGRRDFCWRPCHHGSLTSPHKWRLARRLVLNSQRLFSRWSCYRCSWRGTRSIPSLEGLRQVNLERSGPTCHWFSQKRIPNKPRLGRCLER